MNLLLSFLMVTVTLVNPSLQPIHLWERYRQVMTLRIESLDLEHHQMRLTVVTTHHGEPGPTHIRIQLSGDQAEVSAVTLQPGQLVVALIGEMRAGGDANKVVFYTGTRQSWQLATVSAAATATTPATWSWAGRMPDENDLTQGFGPYWGTWNGHVEQLDRMMADFAADRHYYPVDPLPRFAPEQVLSSAAPGSVHGLAVRDLDGDSKLWVIVAAADQVQVVPLGGEGTPADTAAARGLSGVSARCISAADFNGDGHDDLLLDGQLWLRQGAVFQADPRLPKQLDLIVAAAVEIHGDGWPDVLISLRGGGLRLLRNPGAAGGAFTDVTATHGLDALAGLTGYVAPGDWNGDGRLDLFYAAKKGYLLVQGADGLFVRTKFSVPNQLSFAADAEPLAGASMFTSLWSGQASDVLISGSSRFTALTNIAGVIGDATTSGNEFAESDPSLFFGLPEDYNVDGCIDILAFSAGLKETAALIASRNYASYMRVDKYHRDILPGRLGSMGALAGVATDIDGDGATDLVVAAADGTVGFYRNQTLSDRPLEAAEESPLASAAVYGARVLDIRLPTGLGSVGASVRVVAADGRELTRRFSGAEVLTGCRGPDRWSVAVRESGIVTVIVRFSDGVERSLPITLPTDQRVVRVVVPR